MRTRQTWSQFTKWILGSFAAVIAFSAVLIIVFDPYHNIPFSPPLERQFMDNNQRYMFPALARSKDYNSALFGTSTVRTLPLETFDHAFNTRFSMLALDAGTAWEQLQIAKLFLRHHPTPDTIIYGVDLNWCYTPKQESKLTVRPFPPWMYDDNPYNDLRYALSGKSLEIATRQLRYYFGLDITRYDQNGFDDFLPPDDEYDLARARVNIYGRTVPKKIPKKIAVKEETLESLQFVDHDLFAELLQSIPAQTRLIIIYPPHHAYFYSMNFARLEACKTKIASLTRKIKPDAYIFDLMKNSDLTRADENFWDGIHYNQSVAASIATMVVDAVEGGESLDGSVMTIR